MIEHDPDFLRTTFSQIVCLPDILNGKPVIRGTRISVEFILELVASGASVEQIVAAYPHLTREDVVQALRFAAYRMSESHAVREAVPA